MWNFAREVFILPLINWWAPGEICFADLLALALRD